jgi:hypothetical protein
MSLYRTNHEISATSRCARPRERIQVIEWVVVNLVSPSYVYVLQCAGCNRLRDQNSISHLTFDRRGWGCGIWVSCSLRTSPSLTVTKMDHAIGCWPLVNGTQSRCLGWQAVITVLRPLPVSLGVLGRGGMTRQLLAGLAPGLPIGRPRSRSSEGR